MGCCSSLVSNPTVFDPDDPIYADEVATGHDHRAGGAESPAGERTQLQPGDRANDIARQEHAAAAKYLEVRFSAGRCSRLRRPRPRLRLRLRLRLHRSRRRRRRRCCSDGVLTLPLTPLLLPLPLTLLLLLTLLLQHVPLD